MEINGDMPPSIPYGYTSQEAGETKSSGTINIVPLVRTVYALYPLSIAT